MQKPKVLTLIVFSLLFTHLSAQEGSFKKDSEQDDKKFRFGLRFDPNISWLNSGISEYARSGAKLGFAYGISTEFFIGRNYLFSTGFSLSSLGGGLVYEGVYNDNNGVNVASEIDEKLVIKYIEIPLVLKMRTNEIGYLTYYGNFGFKSGINYKSTGDFDYKDINGGVSVEDEDISGDTYFLNMALVIGGGVEYNLSGNTNLMVGVTFNNGFINQLDSKVHELDASGKALLNGNSEPVYSEKDANATLNYISLDLGVYF